MQTATSFALRVARRSVAGALLAISALVAVSACAPASPTQPTVAPHKHPSASASPTPTAAALAPPSVRISLNCDQLAPAAQLNTVMSATMSSWDPNPDPDLTKYMAIQDGALNCHWTGPLVKGDPSATYDVLVMPDATGTWQQYSSQLSSPYPVGYLGANAHGNCYSDNSSGDHSQGCSLDILIGSVWLDVVGYTTTIAATPTTAQVQSKYQGLLRAAVTAVKGVTVTEPAWTDPAATVVSLPATEGAVTQSTFEAAIGTTFASEVVQPDFDLAGAFIAEMLPVNFREDAGGGTGAGDTVTPPKNYGMQIEILPSGSWAFEQISSSASGDPNYATLTGLGSKAVTYTGATDSYDKNDTVIVGTVGEHLYSINVGDPGTAGTPNTLTLAKAAAAYVVKELTS